MSGWRIHEGRAALLERDNVDTDQLIPARFMSTPRSEGYGDYLLHDMRDRPEYTLSPGDSVLIAGPNFGCGSSREAAVYALVDFGIRAVLAPGFGDIFASNAVNNGLLPAVVDASALDIGAPVRIDLERLEVTQGATTLRFELDPVWQKKLINGWDDIDLTRARMDDIAAFRTRHVTRHPWVVPQSETGARAPN